MTSGMVSLKSQKELLKPNTFNLKLVFFNANEESRRLRMQLNQTFFVVVRNSFVVGCKSFMIHLTIHLQRTSSIALFRQHITPITSPSLSPHHTLFLTNFSSPSLPNKMPLKIVQSQTLKQSKNQPLPMTNNTKFQLKNIEDHTIHCRASVVVFSHRTIYHNLS